MKYIYFILFAFLAIKSLHASDKESLTDINGKWECVRQDVTDDITTKVTIISNINTLNMTYYDFVTTTIKYKDKLLLAELKGYEKGSFHYQNSKMWFDVESFDIKVVTDESNYISSDVLTKLKKDIVEDQTKYQTVSIDSYEWEYIDLETNEKLKCLKR